MTLNVPTRQQRSSPLDVGQHKPELEHYPLECDPAPCMQKYRVYTDGETHAQCIVEHCEAKVCSFKDANLDSRRPASKQAAFCVEHHNQLADMKVRRLSVGSVLGKCIGQLAAILSLTGLPVQSWGCREMLALHMCMLWSDSRCGASLWVPV